MYPTTADERAIYEQHIGHFRALDAGDLESAARILARGVIRTPEGSWEGEAGALALFRQIKLHDGTPRTKHLMSTCDIRIADDRPSATSLCYVLTLQATPNLPLQLIHAARYADEFTKEAGQWYLTVRDATIGSLYGNLAHHHGG